jgi:hypothetical protein
MQQAEHFTHEYISMILSQIPPLVPYYHHSSHYASRVGVIPSSIKRSPIILPNMHEATTLTRKLEPSSNKTMATTNNKSVFSGPHYLPEKYSIKAVTTFRQTYFVPNYNKHDQLSRYYVTPNINHYFQAALQDGSYFESYTTYKASDPVNFRHAYSLKQPQNNRK